MLALCPMEGNTHLSYAKSYGHYHVLKAQFLFPYYIVLLPKSNIFGPRTFGRFPNNQFLFQQCCIVRVLTLLPFLPKPFGNPFQNKFGVQVFVRFSVSLWLFFHSQTNSLMCQTVQISL